ncbi:MAG TPA: radical SAM protein [Firmicutes bacterium]|nr:radical SAM protein [Bacillota bacterium]
MSIPGIANTPDLLRGHPCFDQAAHFRVGRIHLPVAPLCNISCRYCVRALNEVENRPGVASAILSPAEALARTREAVRRDPSIHVVGIAGPGDPLANPETFETLAAVHRELPRLAKCVSTNGLLLPDAVPRLARVGVTHLTVTVNAVTEEVGKAFYRGHVFRLLRLRQFAGIRAAAQHGIVVKVNTVLVPELNARELVELALLVRELGASLMNIIPLKPQGAMAGYRAPTCAELEAARDRCEAIIPQFRLCRQCRADAAGIPGRPDHGAAHRLAWREGLADATPACHF